VEVFDAIVLGAGISGMVSASVLLDQGKRTILLVDDFPHLGGNHVCLDIGPYTFDIGSFIFHDQSPFFARFPAVLRDYVPFDGSTGKIDPRGRLIGYPFDVRAELLSAGPFETCRQLGSLLYGRLRRNPDENALEFVRYWLGDRLATQSGLVSYLSRFYATEPSLIESEFARKRMRWISNNASLKGQLNRFRRRIPSSGRSLGRPRAGFAGTYEKAGDALRARGVRIETAAGIRSVSRDGNGMLQVVADRFAARSATVVSTVPLPVIGEWCNLPCEASVRCANLVTLFYSFEGRRGFDRNILFNFTRDGLWKRLTMHSDCYGKADGREYFSVEVVQNGKPAVAEPFDQDFSGHVRRMGLFDGDLRLEGMRLTTSAYPVYLDGATAAANRMIQSLKDFGILSFGRQGGFDYQPTAYVSTVTAERALRQLESR
jgi:protoporphyrinogen oxidase